MLNKKSSIYKILLIKFRGIGDVILSTVAIKNIKAMFPEAKIDFLTEKASALILKEIPLINEVLVYNYANRFEIVKKIYEIRSRKYDLVIDFYSNPKSAQITFASGAKLRAGFPYRGRKYAYNLFGPEERGVHHAGELHLLFLEKIGIKTESIGQYLCLSADSIAKADRYFEVNQLKKEKLVTLVPGGGWDSKRCDPSKFAEIGNTIHTKYGVRSMILWGKGDIEEAEEIKKLMGGNAILAPTTSFMEMGAFATHCLFAVANDSGPMHFISALGVPTLAVHGPTDPKLQGPYGEKHETVRLDELDCICCNLLKCNREHECFLKLPIERITQKISDLIKKNDILITINEKN
jgi:ADP-heptose:LPS heptosyltransferase